MSENTDNPINPAAAEGTDRDDTTNTGSSPAADQNAPAFPHYAPGVSAETPPTTSAPAPTNEPRTPQVHAGERRALQVVGAAEGCHGVSSSVRSRRVDHPGDH